MIRMLPVMSSNISEIGYDEFYKILAVKFSNLTIYYYYDVPKEQFDNLLSATSTGKYFALEIKNKFKYLKQGE